MRTDGECPAREAGAGRRDERKNIMAKHMTEEDRQTIESCLRRGWTIAQISERIGRPESTVAREVKKRRIDSDKGVRASNALCARFGGCTRRDVCAVPCGMRKLCRNCHRCFEACADFLPRRCGRLEASPFVCNGCERERTCPLGKKYYIAKVAQGSYVGILHGSREGVRATDGQLAAINGVFSDCIRRGQSIRNVMANNPEMFPVCERTMYNYVGLRMFDAVRGDLPFACSRKPRTSRPQTKTDAKCRVGRTHSDLVSFWIAHPDARGHEAEADGLEGQKADGRYMFTDIFNDTGLALGFIRDGKTSADCRAVFDTLWEAAGPALFRRLFRVVVTDNGPEFSDPAYIERDPLFVPQEADVGLDWAQAADPAKYRARVFYANAYSPRQKPHVERVHEEVRRVLVKGCSFASLSQDDVNLVFSHVNSYTRGVLGDETPYDRFVAAHGAAGRRFLDRLGIVRVAPNEVNLTPSLLGEKFARHVAQVILHRNGVA